MDQETLHLIDKYQQLDQRFFATLSIQELFDLRHDMLHLKNKLGQLLEE
ncbi:hypothetical protein [Lutimonas sp.]